MLFINFLCLFYLMVLVTSHTISKSIASTELFDGIDDSFNGLDSKRNRRAKHDRIRPRQEVFWRRSPEVRSITEIIFEGETGTEKHGRKAARNLQGLWKKYHNRKAKNKSVPEVQIKPHYSNLFNNLGTESSYNNLVEYVTNSYLKSAKEAKLKKLAKGKRKKTRDYSDLINIEDNLEKPPMKHRRSLQRQTSRYTTRPSTKAQYDENSNITYIIGSMTTKLNELKKLYSKPEYSSVEDITESAMNNKKKAKYKSLILEPDGLKSTASLDNYEGTAAIEAILNEVKCRAIDMIASQTPGLTDLISNAVTETTYSVDPLLKHDMNVINPIIAVSTLVTINEFPDNEVPARAMKKEVMNNNPGYYIFKTGPTRKARYAQKEATTPSQNMDEGLQNKLKTIFQKVKQDLNNIRAENKKIQETLKWANKSVNDSTDTAKVGSSITSSFKDPDDESPRASSSYQGAFDDQKEKVPSRHKNQEPTTFSTVDASMFEDKDYEMLSVYEHILAKTQESNMMKYLSTKLHPSMRRDKKAPAPRIKKEMRSADPDDSYPNNSLDQTNTDLPIEETSFEALTQKLAYNDFVNGYKHYLQFEKDMANQNFSNLVRYQAHKHHAVDEIGKYILDKIPQIPPAMQDRFKRNFFDYYDDDQDISTQNDDSWIKKYFNYFVEHSQTPKKYHTSQTVPMKAPIEYKNHTTERIDKIDHKDFLKNHVLLRTHTADMNLDQLTHMIKQDTTSSAPLPFTAHQKQRSPSSKKKHFNQNLMAIKNALSPHSVDKFFSEIGRSAKKLTNKKYNIENTEEAVVEESKESRSRRELVDDDQMQIHQDEQIHHDDQIQLHEDYPAVYEEREPIQASKPEALTNHLDNAPAEEVKPKGKKISYAKVDVVPAACKGHIKKKKGKFMTWLEKLKWHKKKPKPKRQVERVPRFNIVKKLKQLFDGKGDKFDKLGLSDYELATTELEGFRPIKYDSAQRIHDIEKQLPDIFSDDRKVASKDVSYMSHHTSKKPTNKEPSQKKYEKNYHTIISPNLENLNEGMNSFNPTQPVDSAKIQQIKHEIDTIDMKLSSSTSTKARVRNVQTRKSLYGFDGNPMNSQDIESPGLSESDAVNLNPLTQRPRNSEDKSRNILTRDAKSHFSQFHNNYDDYNLGGQMAATEAEMGDYMKKRESSLQNDSEDRTIANTNHKIDPSQDTATTTASYDDSVDDFDDLIMWNNKILNSDMNWPNSLEKATEESKNMSDQFADFYNNSRTSKNQSDDDIGEMSTNFHNSAMKYSKPDSVSPSRTNQHRSDKKQQPHPKSFFLDDDRIVTSEVMLKRLNSLNGILGRPEERLKNIYIKKNNKPGIVENLSDRDIVDSTIFAYDDGYGFFNDENRKLSKNQVDLGNNSTTSLTTITPPPQRYNTPLPMRPQQFNKFLKYNNLDVQTVTSPIPETPDLGAWAHKDQEQNRAKTEPYDVTEMKRKLHIPIALSKNLRDHNDDRKSRNQVSRQVPDESEMIWPNLEFNYRDLKQSFKRKLKFNKPEEKSPWLSRTFPGSTKEDKEIELTLINFENEDLPQGSDFDLNYYDPPYHKDEQTEATKPTPLKAAKPKSTVTTEDTDNLMSEKLSEEREKSFLSTTATTKSSKSILSEMDPRVALKILHNQLIYNHSLKPKTTSDATDIFKFSHLHKQPQLKMTTSEREGFQISLQPSQTNANVATKMTRHTTRTTPFLDVTGIFPYDYNQVNSQPSDGYLNTLRLISRMRQQKMPKRVQIHSHSYKYNVEYQDDVPLMDKEKGFPALIINQMLKQMLSKKNKHEIKPSHSEFKKQIHKSASLATRLNPFAKTLEFNPGRGFHSSTAASVTPKSKKTRVRMRNSDWEDYMRSRKMRKAKRRQKRFTWRLPSRNLLVKSSTPALNTMSVIVSSCMVPGKRKEEQKRDNEQQRSKDVTTKLTEPAEGLVAKMYRNYTDIGLKKEANEETIARIDKRESSDFYTAKDVAALEVIIDLIKSTVSDDDISSVTPTPSMMHLASDSSLSFTPTFSLAPPEFPVTNSIQVHIALPNFLDTDLKSNKRSIDRLRKVFSAKMYTPVDLEYQIHSFDETPETTTAVPSTTMLPPGMYLLVENCNASLPRGSFILKPIAHNINLANLSVNGIKVRHAEAHAQQTHTDKVTTTPSDKLSKVTLSKDFVAAINKHLMQLYESLHNNDNEKDKKITRNVHVNAIATKRTRRGLNWKNIRNYFHTSKQCHCKANRTMCRACAASDAVMGELIFELNNLVKYMNDHCVEIQTYFRSNPSGGRKLRDAVRKVDQSLDSYYKRVKGKCKVKTCCDTYTFIKKRELISTTANASDSHKNYMKLADDIESLAHNLNNASKLNVCFNDALKKKTYKLFGVVAKCTNQSNSSSVNKNKSEKGKCKNVYALDNVNVNIICNTDSSNRQLASANQDANRYGQHLLDDFADESENTHNNNNEKKRKWFFKNIFRRKENNHGYPKLDKFRKREVQIDSPLNADTGGSFWSDYIHKIQTDRPRLVRQTNKRETERTSSSTLENLTSYRNDPLHVTVTYRSTTPENNTDTSIGTKPITSLTAGDEATEKAAEESLNYNINELFRLLGNVYIADGNETIFTTGTTSNIAKTKNNKETTTLKPSDWYNCKKKKNKGKCKVCKKTKCKCANKKKTTKNTTKNSDITSLTIKCNTKANSKVKTKAKTKANTKTKKKTTKTTIKPVVTSLLTKSLLDIGDVNTTGIWGGVSVNSLPTSVTQLIDTLNKIKNTTMGYVNDYYRQRMSSKVTAKSTTTAKDNQISRLLHMLGARSFSDKNKEDNTVMNTEIEITSDENPTILIINDDELSEDATEETQNITETTKKLSTTKEQYADETTKLSNDQAETISDQTEKMTKANETDTTAAAQTSNITILRQTSKPKHTTVSQTSKTTNVTETTEDTSAESTEESSNTDETKKSTEEGQTAETTTQSDGDTNGVNEEATDGRTENVIKSLLLSVLKFETKRLDSEYERLIGRSAEDNVAARAAARPADDIINLHLARLCCKSGLTSPSLNTTGLTSRPSNLTTPKRRIPSVTHHADYDLFGPLYDLAHDLPLARRLGQENIVNKFLHKFVVKTKHKEEPSVEVRLHSVKGQQMLSTLLPSVTKETMDDSDSEGIISAALILRDHKDQIPEEVVLAKGPTVTVQFQTSAPTKNPRSYIIVKETCEPPNKICDLQDTFAHLLYCQQQMKTIYYDKFLKTMSCYKYIDAPDYFLIRRRSNKFFCFSKDEILDEVNGKGRFDRIRSRRGLNVNNYAENENNEDNVLDRPTAVDDDSGETSDIKDAAYSLIGDASDDGFETMFKDKYGIYRSVEMSRVKRRADDLERIAEELRNFPPIDIPKNEVFAIEGETVTLTCTPKPDCRGRLTWWVDTPQKHDNVMVEGEQLVITTVRPDNAANYSCGQGSTVLNSTRVRVVTLPIYDIVTTPLYKCNRQCSDYELKVMHKLGSLMTEVGCISESCSINIDRPRCLTDLASNESLLSVRSTMRLPRRSPPCAIEGARDAHASLAVVAAASAPLLAKIRVVVERKDNNVTLIPTTDSDRRLVLSMTLLNDPNIINQAPFSVVPGDIKVEVSCPEGFVLLAKVRICMAMLPSKDHVDIGRRRRLHRYDWWKSPLWWLCVVGGVVVGGVLAVGGAAAVRLGGRPPWRKDTTQVMFHKVSAAASSASGAAPAPATRRRISPSRVILPRLFRHASSRISQETKLDSAKKQYAPPLPPIDFDS